MKISGPINLVVLSKGKKKIFVFFDYHNDLNEQTQCEVDDAVNITTFLKSWFEKTTRELDFFFESSLGNLTIDKDSIRKRKKKLNNYIGTLELWLAEHFLYKKNENKVVRSNKYPKVRFHYIDIRQYFQEVSEDHVDSVESLCRDSRGYFVEIKRLMQKIIVKELKPPKSRRERVLWKIVASYTKPENRDSIVSHLQDFFIPSLNKALAYIRKRGDKLIRLSHEVGIDEFSADHVQCRLRVFLNKVSSVWVDTLTRLVDLFFIRRFVDKDYISDAVLYAGCYHSINVIMLLVKLFGFSISYTSHSTASIEELHSMIRTSKSDDPAMLKKVLWPHDMLQCVDVDLSIFD